MPQDFGAGAPSLGRSFTAAAPSYEIWFRSIDFDVHMSRMFGKDFDRETVERKWGIEHGALLSWANHEYVEIMGPKGKLDTRFHGMGLDSDPSHPTGFKMTPNDRLVGLVANTPRTPVAMDPIFHDDAHLDQTRFPGQLQKADDPNENLLVARVTEEQMLQIKLAMLKETNRINQNNTQFGLSGLSDPNSNSYRATMGKVIEDAARQMGVTVNTDFDPDGASPGAGKPIANAPVQLFKGTLEDLRQEVRRQEEINATQLEQLRQNIDADLSIVSQPARAPAPIR